MLNKKMLVVALSIVGFSFSANAVDVERGMDRVTVCEVRAAVQNMGTQVDNLNLLRGGFKLELPITGETKCAALAERKITRLCKKNNRGGASADTYTLVMVNKLAQLDFSLPFPPCDGPSDPRCLAPLATPFGLEIVEGFSVSGDCSEYVPKLLQNEAAATEVVESDIEGE